MSREFVTIGARIKQARLDKGLSLEEAQKQTKLQMHILAAIESDKLQNFSPTYIKGYVKIYAGYLGLNVKELLDQYQSLYAPKPPAIQLEEKRKVPRRFTIKFSLSLIKPILKIAAAIVVIFIIIVVFNRIGLFFKNRKKAAPKAAVAAVKPVKKESSKKAAVKQKAPAPAPAAQPKAAQPKATQQASQGDSVKLALRLKADSWVQVICDGKKIFEGTLRRQMQEGWEAKKEILLSVSNAGGVEVEVNGKVISPLGRRGEVIRNMRITNEGISYGH